MLLEFKMKNFKSFSDETTFSLLATNKQQDLSYSLFKEKIGSKNYSIQCSSVIYGPNASGKSSIISAMDTLRSIILNGNIHNSEILKGFNYAASTLELIPNIDNSIKQPVEFSIEFIEESICFKYFLSMDIGKFLQEDYPRQIVLEELYLNGSLVFSRSDKVELGEYSKIKKFISAKQNELDSMIKITNGSLNPQELFLTNGFKVIFAPAIVSSILNWISKKFIVIFRADSVELVRQFTEADKKNIYIEKTMNEAIKAFGANSNSIGYFNNKENDSKSKLCSILELNKDGEGAIIPADIFESYGTIRFANLFPFVLKAFADGSTLVIDEFDASIHPSALMNIINMFHNDSINKNHAQLIFNTHNPIFLNSNFFRRDEIKFVQRNPESGSELYALSDFGTSGEGGVRNTTDYMKYYLNYSYGAIEDVDFTSVFEEIMEKTN